MTLAVNICRFPSAIVVTCGYVVYIVTMMCVLWSAKKVQRHNLLFNVKPTCVLDVWFFNLLLNENWQEKQEKILKIKINK